MKLFITILLLIMILNLKSYEDSFINCDTIIGTWKSCDTINKILTLYFIKDKNNSNKYLGQHIFTLQNGNRIDFCEIDEITINIDCELNEYKGFFKSCYTFKEYNILIKIKDDSLKLYFENNDYDLIQDTTIFLRD